MWEPGGVARGTGSPSLQCGSRGGDRSESQSGCCCRCGGPRSGSCACHSVGVGLGAHKCPRCVGDNRQSSRASPCALSNAGLFVICIQWICRAWTCDAAPQGELGDGQVLMLAGTCVLPSLPFSGCGVLSSLPSLLLPCVSSPPVLAQISRTSWDLYPLFSGLPLEWPFLLPHPGTCCSDCFWGPGGRGAWPPSKFGRLCGGLTGMARRPPGYSSLLGLVRLCSFCLAASFPSGALVSLV